MIMHFLDFLVINDKVSVTESGHFYGMWLAWIQGSLIYKIWADGVSQTISEITPDLLLVH